MNITIGDLVREVDERLPAAGAVVFSVSEKHGIVPQTQLFTKTIATDDRSRYRPIRFGDVVYNPYLLWNRAVGVCFDRRGGCVSPAYIVLRPRESDTERFLHYFFRSDALTSAVDAIAAGSVTRRRTAPVADVLNIRFDIPDLAQRKAANAILATLDDKIELNEQMNETLEAMARALFKSWFVDYDPVRAKVEGRDPGLPKPLANLFPDSFEDSELGAIPKGWRCSNLREVTAKIGSGATPRGGGSVYVADGVALIRSQNVYDSLFVWDGLARITDAAADALNGVSVEREDVLLNITGASILRTCVVDPDVLPARVNQHVCIIRPKPEIPARYIHFHLLQPSTKVFLMGMDAGASRQAVTKGHIESVPVVIPPKTVLDIFASLVGPLFGATSNNESQSRSLASIRDALLPKLVSGELRMKDASRFSAEVA